MNKHTKRFHLAMVVTVLAIAIVILGQLNTSQTSAISNGNKVETRCGWFVNPTPANAWLIDRDGEWIIGVQGGHQADGDWPAFSNKKWVKTNGNYGYGCACMKVTVNRETKEVLEIKSATAKSLSVCRKDPALKEPNE